MVSIDARYENPAPSVLAADADDAAADAMEEALPEAAGLPSRSRNSDL